MSGKRFNICELLQKCGTDKLAVMVEALIFHHNRYKTFKKISDYKQWNYFSDSLLKDLITTNLLTDATVIKETREFLKYRKSTQVDFQFGIADAVLINWCNNLIKLKDFNSLANLIIKINKLLSYHNEMFNVICFPSPKYYKKLESEFSSIQLHCSEFQKELNVFEENIEEFLVKQSLINKYTRIWPNTNIPPTTKLYINCSTRNFLKNQSKNSQKKLLGLAYALCDDLIKNVDEDEFKPLLRQFILLESFFLFDRTQNFLDIQQVSVAVRTLQETIKKHLDGVNFDEDDAFGGVLTDIHNSYTCLLLLLSNIKASPYSEPFTIQCATEILKKLVLISNQDLATIKSNIDLHIQQKTLDRIDLRLLPIKFNHTQEIQTLCSRFTVEELVEILFEITLSRFSISETQKQLEEFFLEEYEGIEVTIKQAYAIDPCVKDLFKKFKTNNIPLLQHQKIIAIDGPTGPQQTLQQLIFPIQAANAQLGHYLQTQVIKKLLEFYASDRTTDIKISRTVKTICQEFSCFRNIIDGNRYQDHYEYASNKLTISKLTQKNAKLLDQLNEIKQEFSFENSKLDKMCTTLRSQENSYIEEIERLERIIIRLEETTNKLSITTSSLITENAKNLENESIKGGLHILKLLQNKKKNLRPSECLKLVDHLATQRVEILDSAYSSAHEVDSIFDRGTDLLRLLSKLVTDYYDKYLLKGDNYAREVFTPNEYAAKESEVVSNNKSEQFGTIRNIQYQGKSIVMEQHLKIGVADDRKNTIRVYFFFNNENKIVIGYCGKHPKNTKS